MISTPASAAVRGDVGGAGSPARLGVVIVRNRVLGTPVAHARVRIGGRALRTDRHGVVRLPHPSRRIYRVLVSASGFDTGRARLRFRRGRPYRTVYLWRPGWSWPVYGADPHRRNAQAGIRLRPPLHIIWGLHLDGLLEFPPVTHDGIGYITSARGTLIAFSTETGAWVWRRHLHEDMGASPGYSQGRLFVVSLEGQLRAFDATDGRLLWQRALGSSSESSPMVVGGRVVVGTWDGRVHAFDAATGRRAWVTHGSGKITAALTLSGPDLVYGDYDGTVWALSARTGTVDWHTSIGGQIYATASAEEGRVFVTSSTKKTLSALRAADGHVLWSRHLESWAYPAPAVQGGVVVTGSYGHVVHAYRARDGRELWRASLGDRIYGAPQILAGVVWTSSFARRTDARALRTGRLLQRFGHGRYVPVSGDARTLLLIGYSRIWGLRPGR